MNIIDIDSINGVPIIIDIIEQVGLPNVRTNIPIESIDIITVHNTGNGSPTATDTMHQNYFTNLELDDEEYVGAKIFVDEDSITQILPLLEVAYDTSNKWAQYHSVSIEICENGDYNKAEENAIALIIYLLDKFNLSTDEMVSHYALTGKYCPHIILDYGWDKFVRKVEYKMIEDKTADEIMKGFKKTSDWISQLDRLEKFGDTFDSELLCKYIRPAFVKAWRQGLEDGSKLN